jgi:hypothetical protein
LLRNILSLKFTGAIVCRISAFLTIANLFTELSASNRLSRDFELEDLKFYLIFSNYLFSFVMLSLNLFEITIVLSVMGS